MVGLVSCVVYLTESLGVVHAPFVVEYSVSEMCISEGFGVQARQGAPSTSIVFACVAVPLSYTESPKPCGFESRNPKKAFNKVSQEARISHSHMEIASAKDSGGRVCSPRAYACICGCG